MIGAWALFSKWWSPALLQDFLRNQGRSAGTHSTFITEGLEPAKFRSYFDNWPQTVETKLYEEGRGKVAGAILYLIPNLVANKSSSISTSAVAKAGFFYTSYSIYFLPAMFKQQGYEVKELPDEEDIQPFIDCRGTLKVASYWKKLYSFKVCVWITLFLYVNVIYDISGLAGRWWEIVPSSSFRREKNFQWGLLCCAIYISWQWKEWDSILCMAWMWECNGKW